MHGHDDGRLFAANLPQDIARIDNLVNGSGRRCDRERDDGGGECGRGNDRECGCDPV